MATQRFTIATIGGEAGFAAAKLFQIWMGSQAKAGPDAILDAVDLFANHIRANSAVFPVIYFCEWIGHWSMGDALPNPLRGRGIEAACMNPTEALQLADQCGNHFSESEWLGAQLRQAAEAWKPLVESSVVVLLRKVLGASAIDEEVSAAMVGIPDWLTNLGGKL